MATNERLAAEIPAGTGLNGHCKKLSGMALVLQAFIEAFPFRCRLWDKNTPEVQELARRARQCRL